MYVCGNFQVYAVHPSLLLLPRIAQNPPAFLVSSSANGKSLSHDYFWQWMVPFLVSLETHIPGRTLKKTAGLRKTVISLLLEALTELQTQDTATWTHGFVHKLQWHMFMVTVTWLFVGNVLSPTKPPPCMGQCFTATRNKRLCMKKESSECCF